MDFYEAIRVDFVSIKCGMGGSSVYLLLKVRHRRHVEWKGMLLCRRTVLPSHDGSYFYSNKKKYEFELI